MAERTSIVSKESQNMTIIDKIVRTKIFNCRYWKEECFGLTAESLVDKAIQLQYVGGTYGGPRKPTQFICLIAKLLQINPEKEIIYEFIKTKDYKYVSVLGLFYLRLIGQPREIYQMLEHFYEDYRKIRVRQQSGDFIIRHIDEIIEDMLHEEIVFDILLPRLPKRQILEERDLPPRKSAIEDELVIEEEEEAPQAEQQQVKQEDDLIEEVENSEKKQKKEKKEKKDKKEKKEKKKKWKKYQDKKEKKEKKEKRNREEQEQLAQLEQEKDQKQESGQPEQNI